MSGTSASDAWPERLPSARQTSSCAAPLAVNGRIMVGWDAWLILQLTKILPTRYHWVTARVADD